MSADSHCQLGLVSLSATDHTHVLHNGVAALILQLPRTAAVKKVEQGCSLSVQPYVQLSTLLYLSTLLQSRGLEAGFHVLLPQLHARLMQGLLSMLALIEYQGKYIPLCAALCAKSYLSSHTQQCTPRLPEYTHKMCLNPKSVRSASSSTCRTQVQSI